MDESEYIMSTSGGYSCLLCEDVVREFRSEITRHLKSHFKDYNGAKLILCKKLCLQNKTKPYITVPLDVVKLMVEQYA